MKTHGPGDRNSQSNIQGARRPLLPGTSPCASLTRLQRLARVFRDLTSRLLAALKPYAPNSSKLEEIRLNQLDGERLAHEYSQGYMAGWRECFETCLQAVEDEIASADDVWRMGAALTDSGSIKRDN
jgi:hypothetical protein